MEREGHAATGYRRRDASPEDVIVLSSGTDPRHLHQHQQQQAAGQYPEPPEKVYYKTKLCEKYEVSGRCMYEGWCTFAHGHAELRPPLPTHGGGGGGGWRRPVADHHDHAKGSSGGLRGGRVCFEFRDNGTCSFGDKCAFAHVSAPETRYPGGARQVEAQRSAPPPARAFSPAAAAPRGNSYAPAPARAFSPVPAAAVYDRLRQLPGEDGGKGGALKFLSRKKMSGIYGDWPEEY